MNKSESLTSLSLLTLRVVLLRPSKVEGWGNLTASSLLKKIDFFLLLPQEKGIIIQYLIKDDLENLLENDVLNLRLTLKALTETPEKYAGKLSAFTVGGYSCQTFVEPEWTPVDSNPESDQNTFCWSWTPGEKKLTSSCPKLVKPQFDQSKSWETLGLSEKKVSPFPSEKKDDSQEKETIKDQMQEISCENLSSDNK